MKQFFYECPENKYDELKVYFIEGWDEMNNIIINKIRDFSPKSYLDVGFGTGDILYGVAKSIPSCSKIVGIEPNLGMVRNTEKKYTFPENVEILQTDLEGFTPEYEFDVISLCLVYHNLTEEMCNLNKITGLLKEGGMLIISDFVTSENKDDFIQERKHACDKAIINGVSRKTVEEIYEQELLDSTITRTELKELLVLNGFKNTEELFDVGSYFVCSTIKSLS